MCLVYLKLRVSIVLPITNSDPLSPKADNCKMFHVEDSPASKKLATSVILCIGVVMCNCNEIATPACPQCINISAHNNPMRVYFSIFQLDRNARLDVHTSQSNLS